MTNIREMPKKINQDAINELEDVLAGIRRGEITGVTITCENSDNTYTTRGSCTLSRLQSAGVLLEMAIGRLK